MKSTIQSEAEKAAKKIREALEEFNRVTELELSVGVEWNSRIERSSIDGLLRIAGREPLVYVDVVGLGATAGRDSAGVKA